MCQGSRAHLPTDVTWPFSLTFLLWVSGRRAAVQLDLHSGGIDGSSNAACWVKRPKSPVSIVCPAGSSLRPEGPAAQLPLIQRQLQLPPTGSTCCFHGCWETPAFHQNPAHIPSQFQPEPLGTTLTSLVQAQTQEGYVLLSAELSH